MLNLDEAQPIEYLNMDPTQIPIDPAVAANKTDRAAYGMQPLLDRNTIASYTDNGNEKDLRVNAAAKVNQKWQQEDAMSLRQGQRPALKQTIPSAVLEDQFGEKFIGNFNQTPGEDVEDDNGTFSKIREVNPEMTAAALKIAKEHTALTDKIYNRLQDATAAAEAQKSSTGQLTSYPEDWNILKQMLGVTSLYTERGVVPGTFWQGGFLGGNKEAQRKALLDLPYPDNLDAVDKAADYLIDKDPRAAIDLLSYFYQPSVRTQTLDNAFNALDVAAILPIGKSLAEAGKSWLELQRMTKEAAIRHPEAAVGDIEATAMDAVGKTKEAGESRATKQVVQRQQGTANPTKEMEDGILGVFKSRIDEMQKGGPGNVGADVLNRITEAMDNGSKDLVNISANASRIMRVDPSVTAELVVKNAYDEMMQSHPWLYNEVANIMPIKAEEALQNFKYEAHTGTWSTDIILHRPDGVPFESVQAAQDYAKAKGIPIQSIHGVPLNPGSKELGAAIHSIPTGKPTPGITKSLADLLEEGARNPALSYKEKEGLARLASKTGAEQVETTKVGGLTAYRPANGVFGQGKGFYIAARIPLNETSNLWRDAIIHTPSAEKSNKGWLNSYGLGYFRTADESGLSEQIMINRKLSMYTPSLFIRAVNKYLQPAGLAKAPLRGRNIKEIYNNLGKNSAFERMLRATQDAQIDFHSIPELEDYYQRVEGRFPDAVETEGYFALKWGQDADKAFRDLAVTKHMARLGGERHVLSIVNEAGEVQKSPEFIGMVQKEVPGLVQSEVKTEGIRPGTAKWANKDLDLPIEVLDEAPNKGPDGRLYQKVKYDGKESYVPLDEIKQEAKPTKEIKTVSTGDGRVLIQEGNGFKSKLLKNMTSEADRELLGKVKTGETRMIQLYNSDLFPLKEFSGEQRMVQYVLTDKTETRPLGYFELPKKEAGHLEYDYKNWIRQANISLDEDVAHYLGDRTIMAVQEHALGKDVVKGLEEIRQNLQRGGKDGIAAAKRAVYENHLPIAWREIRRKFKSKEWDLDQPFYVVPNGKTVADIPNHFHTYEKQGFKFREASQGSSPAKQFAVDFTGERDAYDVMSMQSLGTRNNPDLAFKPADTIDAFSSLNRSMQRIIKSTYMDDVKITSVSDWLQRYKHLMDVDNPDDVFKNPWYNFNNVNLKKGVRNTFEGYQVEAERYQIKSFVGIPSWWDNLIHTVEQRMADNVYRADTKTGQRAALAAKWGVGAAVKAPDFLRAVAYRAAIGFFAPAQLLVQSMTYASIFGRAGFKRAGQGSIGALLHQYSRLPGVNDGVLKALDNIAVKLGHFRPGEWLEARSALENSGFEYVGHETNTMRAYAYPNKIFKSTFGHVLDAGEIFFNEGERHTRYGAWYTAYAEHRTENPTGRLTMADRNRILNMADDHAGNMTQASRSFLQKGILSFPTQFLGYWLRTMEQFTGKRLSYTQKARMFAVYATIFGLPIGAAITPLMPFSEAMNKAASNAGYVPFEIHENVGKQLVQLMEDIAMQGAGAVAINAATGKKLNVGTRYGPGPGHGFDFLNSDKPFWSTFTGPLGDMLGQSMRAVEPFWFLGSQFIQGKERNKLTPDDWVQPFKIVSSINASWKFAMAMQYQTWYSRNGNPLADNVSPMFAAVMATTGLQPLDVDRMETFRNIGTDREAQEKAAESLVKTEMTRFFRDVKNNDDSNAQLHWNNAEVYLTGLGYPEQQRDTLWAIIASENEQILPDRVMWNHYLGKHIPAGKEEQSIEQYGKELNAQGKQ